MYRARRQLMRSAGFSLVEVLVTLVIFGLGVLSAAAVQGLAKKASYEALQRSSAAYLAFDLFERMRSNPSVLADYLAAGTLGGGSRGAEPAPNCKAVGSECTTQQLAGYDLWEWETMVDGIAESKGGIGRGGLVDPTTCINGPAGGGQGIYTIAIAWRGVTELENPIADNCGVGSGKYGSNDAYRRLLVVQTFLSDT